MFRLVLLSLFFYTAYGATCSSDIYNYGSWDSSTNTFTVTSNVPDFANDSDSPFYNCQIEGESEYSVVFSNAVTSIGKNAFGENDMTSLTIGNSVTTIGQAAFANNKLTEINIPDSVTTIGRSAFYQNLASTSVTTSVTIGNGLTSIDSNAFYNNPLTSLTIHATLVAPYSVGFRAFFSNRIASLTAPKATIMAIISRSPSQDLTIIGEPFLSDASCSDLKSTYNTAVCCV